MNIERKPNYIHLSSDLVLTNWDGQDIMKYTGSKHVYVHSEEEVETYYEISELEHFANEDAREKAEMPELEEEKLTEE